MDDGWRRWCKHFLFWCCMLLSFFFGRSTVGPTDFSEIDPDFRVEVDKMYADFKARKVLYQVRAEVAKNVWFDVDIVADYFRADYGFATTDRPIGTYFFVQAKDFRIQRFDKNTLFFSIKDRYVLHHKIREN